MSSARHPVSPGAGASDLVPVSRQPVRPQARPAGISRLRKLGRSSDRAGCALLYPKVPCCQAAAARCRVQLNWRPELRAMNGEPSSFDAGQLPRFAVRSPW